MRLTEGNKTGKYEVGHAYISGKLEGAVAFENAGHALWGIIYEDGSRSRFHVIALASELEDLGLVEREKGTHTVWASRRYNPNLIDPNRYPSQRRND